MHVIMKFSNTGAVVKTANEQGAVVEPLFFRGQGNPGFVTLEVTNSGGQVVDRISLSLKNNGKISMGRMELAEPQPEVASSAADKKAPAASPS